VPDPLQEALSHDLMNCILDHPDTVEHTAQTIKFDSISRFSNSLCAAGQTRIIPLNKNFISVLVVQIAVNNSSAV